VPVWTGRQLRGRLAKAVRDFGLQAGRAESGRAGGTGGTTRTGNTADQHRPRRDSSPAGRDNGMPATVADGDHHAGGLIPAGAGSPAQAGNSARYDGTGCTGSSVPRGCCDAARHRKGAMLPPWEACDRGACFRRRKHGTGNGHAAGEPAACGRGDAIDAGGGVDAGASGDVDASPRACAMGEVTEGGEVGTCNAGRSRGSCIG